MIKKITALLISTAGLFVFAVPAFAHVIVSPKQVGVAAFQEFNMAVPAEKGNTTAIKLLIPDGLQSVTPNVKSGWTISVKKKGTDDTSPVTEIDWTGGTIPQGQRDTFQFQAQVPAKESTLQWKAYQTYSDGTVVAWDHAPSKDPTDDAAPPPYSTTKVVNDLTGANSSMAPSQTQMAIGRRYQMYMWLGVIGFILSVVAISMQLRKKK